MKEIIQNNTSYQFITLCFIKKNDEKIENVKKKNILKKGGEEYYRSCDDAETVTSKDNI